MAVFDLDAYKAKLKTAGVPDDVIAEVDTGIKPGFLRQDEFSRYQQEHQRAMATVQDTYDKLTVYENSIRSLEQTYGPREQWPQAFAQQIAAQNPDGTNRMTPSGLTAADLDTRIAQMREELRTEYDRKLETVGQGAAAFAEFQFDAHQHWLNTYGTPLPKAEFKEFFTKNGHTDPRIALSLFEVPYAQEKTTKDWEKKLEAARLEGMQTGRSQAGTPDGGLLAGSWMNSNISIGAAADRAPATPPPVLVEGVAPPAAGEMSRSEMIAKFRSGMDQAANATGGFQEALK